MSTRVRRLVVALAPAIPVLLVLGGVVAEGAKRWL